MRYLTGNAYAYQPVAFGVDPIGGLPSTKPPQPPPTVDGPPATAPKTSGGGGGGVPDWIVVAGSIIVVGGAAELLERVSPKAGYMFAAIVLLGFFAAGNRVQKTTEFLRSIGVVA